jgi:glycolate oxidase FAD binding subunit
MLDNFGTQRLLESDESRSFWRRVREVEPLELGVDEALWRVSVRPSAGPKIAALASMIGGRSMLDWGGGLVWIAAAPGLANHAVITEAVRTEGGATMLFRAPDDLRISAPVLPGMDQALHQIEKRVKHALDPDGLFNPGHLRG